MKKIAASALLLSCLSLSTQVQVKRCPSDNQPKPRQTYFKFNVDDFFLDLSINGNSLNPQFSQEEGKLWATTHTMNINLAPGDTISIKGKNSGGPTGIVGTIHYFNKYGVEKQISTCGGWKCNGAPAVVYGLNDGTATWPHFDGIASNAAWIWSKDNVDYSEATCTYTLPCDL